MSMVKNNKKDLIEQLRGITQKRFIQIATAATVLTSTPSMAQQNIEQNNKNIAKTEQYSSNETSQEYSSSISFTEAQQDLQLELDTALANNLISKMHSPVDQSSQDLNLSKACIGNLNYLSCVFHGCGKKDSKNNKKIPEIKKVQQGHERFRENDLAYFRPVDNTIYFQDNKQSIDSVEMRDSQIAGISHQYEFFAGNPAAHNSTILHEKGHWQTINSCNLDKLKNPADIFRCYRIDEKRSYVIEYLNVANQYSILKEQGIETIQFNNEKHSIEGLLDFYPGLREYVKENGFSIQNKTDIEKITEIACKDWDKYFDKNYSQQFYISTLVYGKSANTFDVLSHDPKEYDKVVDKMLNNVYIGHNTYVDIPRGPLDNMNHEQTLEVLGDKSISLPEYYPLTFNEVMQLSKYYESKGITDNQEKSNALLADFESVIYRTSTLDSNLASILTKDELNITYADGLSQTINKKGEQTLSYQGNQININQYKAYSQNSQIETNIPTDKKSSNTQTQVITNTLLAKINNSNNH